MAVPPGVGSENLANPMFVALVGAGNAILPEVDIFDPSYDMPWEPTNPVFQPVEKVTVQELVSCAASLYASFKTLLEEQSDKGRITNADYAKTYLGLSQVAMSGAVQFMLGKDQAYWMAVRTQAEAVKTRMENEETRMRVMLLRAQFANAKLELSGRDSQFGVSEVQRTGLIPAQVDLTKEQHETARAQTLETRVDGSSIGGVIGGQKLLTAEQRGMVHEQMESQRAQTLDTRQDGQSRAITVPLPDGTNEPRIAGLLGTQNGLYRQQIMSYREDGKVKAGRLFSELWMTMKTIDDGTQPPDYIRPPAPGQTTPMDSVFKSVRNIAIGNESDPWVP